MPEVNGPVVEEWENVSAGKVMVNRFTGLGHEERQDAVTPGRTILISTQERTTLNSDRCYAESADPFVNGIMRPVTLVETSSDLVDDDNPNHMSESDITAAFKARNYLKFKKSISGITSVALLDKMLAVAQLDPESDNNVDATAGQVSALQDRIESLAEVSIVEMVQTNIPSAVGARE